MNVTPKAIEIQYRIANQLPRPVVGDIPPPIGLIYLDSLLIQEPVTHQDMVETALSSDGNAGMMLQQNDRVRYEPAPSGLIQFFL